MKKNRTNRSSAPTISDAISYAEAMGYKYCEKPHTELKVGDIVEIGLNSWEVVQINICNGKSEVSYRAVGRVKNTDNEYWTKVRASKEEKNAAKKEYYEDWKRNEIWTIKNFQKFSFDYEQVEEGL